MNNLPSPPPGFSQLTILQNTKIKSKPSDSSLLANNEKADLTQGQNFLIIGYVSVAGHFRVTLSEAIPNFGKIGYVYAPHVQIQKDGQAIAYDPNAVTLTVLKNATFKKQPVDEANLTDGDKTNFPVGMIYGVSGYSFESGQLKVSLTENIPNFGNTGYLQTDVVQLNRGGEIFNLTPILTYRGPKELFVKQLTILNGTFDPKQVTNISLVAEDKYPLNVSLNKKTGVWQTIIKQGFQATGARWLRLKGANSAGKIVGNQVIKLTVITDNQIAGQNFTLNILKDTFFKISPNDSSKLNDQQKVFVKAGQTYTVSNYGYIDGHLKIALTSLIPPLGNFGYFYEGDVQLNKGNQILRFDIEDVPNSNLSAQMLVTEKTRIKIQPIDSTHLADNQKADLLQGQTLAITGYACTQGHFRVTLAEPIPGFGNVGYIYWLHVRIKKDNQVIAYDPDALTVTILQPTILKKKPVDGSQLNDNEKATMPLGRVYGLSSYGIEQGHIKVALTEQLPPIGNTGYVYPSYVLMRRGGTTINPYPSQVELNVPYFSQRDNPRFYESTCNVTSISMAFYYYGVRSQSDGRLEDELLQWCLDKYGEGSQTDHDVLNQLICAYGFKTSFSTGRRWSDVTEEIINRRPVILAGNFTPSGHIICVVGFTPDGLIVNDPWGDALSGYDDTEGAKLLYPNSYLNDVAGPDGNVWAHFISR